MCNQEKGAQSSSWSDGRSYLPVELAEQKIVTYVERPVIGRWEDPEWRFQSDEEIAKFVLGENADGLSVFDKLRLLEHDYRRLGRLVEGYKERLKWRRVEE